MIWLLAAIIFLAVGAYVTYPLLHPPRKREKEEAKENSSPGKTPF